MIKESNKGIATLLAFALMPLSGFATDIYIPSLPSMTSAIGASSLQVQFTLTLFLISYGVSQLFIGSVLDSFGRYKAGLISLVIFAAASIVIANTQNIYLIYAMRVIHGLTVGTIIVGKRAYFVDLFSGDKLKHYLSLFSIIWSSGPIIAPFIGGYLQTSFGWKSNFYLLAGLAIVLAILEGIFGGETLKTPSRFNLKNIFNTYLDMFKTTSFVLGMGMIGLAYSMVMVYNMTGPFIIEHQLHLTPVTAGYGALISGFAWMTGGFIAKGTIRYPFFKKLIICLALQILFVGAMLLSTPIVSSLHSLLFFAFIIHACAGYIFNNYFAFCLGRFPKNAGIASGLTGGFMYVIVSTMSSGIVSILPAENQANLAYSYLILVLISALVMTLVFKVNKNQKNSLQAA